MSNYHLEQDQKNTLKLRELIKDLPPYTKEFFRGIEQVTSSRTRIAYAYDLNVFFRYLHENNSVFSKKEIAQIALTDLESLTSTDIEEYLDYVKLYSSTANQKGIKTNSNQLQAIKRKLASLRTFYKYFYNKEAIHYNPVELVPMPKLHDKSIVRLEADEVAELLDNVESGEKLTKHELCFHGKNKLRDVALMTLMLGTGIRVSECVGLDISDIDFKKTGILIHRKGGKEVTVYFSDEVEAALQDYLVERKGIEVTTPGDENALFLSTQRKRICIRSVENLVKKYTKSLGIPKKITPHKLRSTYGTALYRETGDIYLVADVLGHSDVNTTRKHYAAIEDDKRWRARDKVRLRSE